MLGVRRNKTMSWNLRIHKRGAGPSASEPLGQVETVSEILKVELPGLEWASGNECRISGDGACSVRLIPEGGNVTELRTVGSWEHLTRLAPLCKRHGWCMAFVDEGNGLDVDFYALCWERRCK